MTVYRYESAFLCYDCYLEACEGAEDMGHSEYLNKEGDPHYYPITVASKPNDAPTHCEGDYCYAELEWE